MSGCSRVARQRVSEDRKVIEGKKTKKDGSGQSGS